MNIKSVKMKIKKNKKMHFFLISQGSLNPKIRFIGRKVCSVARVQTDTNVNTEDTLSGFQEFFLQLIIKDRSSNTQNLLNKEVCDKNNNTLSNFMNMVNAEYFDRSVS